jgi:hypothetical protein
MLLPCSLVRNFKALGVDILLPHYPTFLPPYERVFLGGEEAQLAEILTLAKAERPITLVGIMRNNSPRWGLCGNLHGIWTQPMIAHGPMRRPLCFAKMWCMGLLDCDWLLTRALELIMEDAFAAHLVD